MGIKIFYFIRGEKIFFYVVKFFFEKLNFFGFLSKIGATYSCETLGFSWKYLIYGGSLKRRNQFRRRPLLWNSHTGPGRYGPQKVPSGTTFLVNFFGLYFMKLFMGNNPFFMVFVVQIDGKCFFLRFLKKKSKNLTFWMISPNNHVQTGHFIITKFCQDAKKTILVKVWPLIKSLLAVCHSTADPKSLNFISKCIFMDRDRSVSAQMGFSKQIMAIANRNFNSGWYQPTMAAIGRSAANFCSSRLFLIFFKYFKVR